MTLFSYQCQKHRLAGILKDKLIPNYPKLKTWHCPDGLASLTAGILYMP